jgi:hypothetical protein
MSEQKHFILAALLAAAALLLFSGPAAAQDIYAGEGQSQLGPKTTPQEAKELAFQLARKNALRQFGAEVRSRQKLQTASSSAGRTEMTEEEIAVLSTGDASLIDSTKKTSRRVTEETMVYTVTAKFRIDPPKFEETLEAYQKTSPGSEMRQSVSTAVQTQKRMNEFAKNAGRQDANELLSRTRKAYSNVEGNVRKIDSEDVSRRFKRENQKQENSVLRYLANILELGFPSDMVETQTASPQIEDSGGGLEIKYRTRLQPKNFRKLATSCREGSRVWDRQAGPAPEFPVLKKPVRLFLLDEQGQFLSMIDKANGHEGRGPVLEIDYNECHPDRMFSHYNFDGIGSSGHEVTWEFEMSESLFAQVDELVVATVREDYDQIARENGYRLEDNFVWIQRSGSQLLSVENLIYTRQRFQREIESNGIK